MERKWLDELPPTPDDELKDDKWNLHRKYNMYYRGDNKTLHGPWEPPSSTDLEPDQELDFDE